MTRRQAEQIADILEGDVSPGDEPLDEDDGWLVLFERRDGRLVVLSSCAVDEYADRDAFRHAACYATILLRDHSA